MTSSWECVKCGYVWNMTVMGCANCNKPHTKTVTNPSIPEWPMVGIYAKCSCHEDAQAKGLLIRGQCTHGNWAKTVPVNKTEERNLSGGAGSPPNECTITESYP